MATVRAEPYQAPEGSFGELCGGIAVAVPFALTATSVTGATSWRTDEAIVRTMGFGLSGAEGLVSATLGQMFMLVPLGGRVMRAGWVGAAATAFGAWAIYVLALHLLRRLRPSPRLGPPLALAASMIATLGPSWQTEGTTPGGAAVAAALVLGALALAASGPLDSRRWAALGVLFALATAENHAAGLALLTVTLLASVVSGRLPRRRDLVWLGALAAGSLAAVLAPAVAATLGSETSLALGPDPLSTRLSTLFDAERQGPLEAWFAEVGIVACALALVGGAIGIARAATRPVIAALTALVVFDAAFPSARGMSLATDPLAPLHLLSPAALAIAMVVAVHSAALALLVTRVRFAETAAVLLVVFCATVVAVTIDQARPSAAADQTSPADVWTDEALSDLPAESLVLVQSPAVAYRLWASRLVSGTRPDIVVVPVPWLSRGALASHLLRLEPGLAPLIRELAVRGTPSEYALSALADRRSLFVEVDAAWDVRLVEHLIPRSLWLGFAPHALGRYDRTSALETSHRSLRRVLREARRGAVPDQATLSVLGGRARQQAIALAALGDRDSVAVLLRDLRAIDPAHPFVPELERRLAADGHGRVDVRGLIE